MFDLFKAVVLGLIQGLTEFLPISSSAHLRIFPELFGWGDPGAAFTAVIQIGTELAVLIFFRKDIWRIATMWLKSLVKPEYRGHIDARMGWYIIIGSLLVVSVIAPTLLTWVSGLVPRRARQSAAPPPAVTSSTTSETPSETPS